MFMENQLMNIGLIKAQGINGSAYRGDRKFAMIAAKDIAAYAAEHLAKRDFGGSMVRPLLGQRDLSLIEATQIIGKKIGKPELTYVSFSYKDAEAWLGKAGWSPDMARLYLEMSRAFNGGRIGPAMRTFDNTTPTTFEQFCDEVLVPLYRSQKAA